MELRKAPHNLTRIHRYFNLWISSFLAMALRGHRELPRLDLTNCVFDLKGWHGFLQLQALSLRQPFLNHPNGRLVKGSPIFFGESQRIENNTVEG